MSAVINSVNTLEAIRKKAREQRDLGSEDPKELLHLCEHLGPKQTFQTKSTFGLDCYADDVEYEGYAAPSMFTPPIKAGFMHNQRFLKAISTAWFNRGLKGARMSGPPGCGKTENALQFLACLNLPVQFYQCHNDTIYEDLVGHTKLIKGETVFVPGALTLAMRFGHVLYLSEEDRAKPGVKIILNPILERKPLTIPTIGVIYPSDDFWVIADGNTSFEGDVYGEFPGAKTGDRSTMNRYFHLAMDYYSPEFEQKVLFSLMPEFNQNKGTRQSVEIVVKVAKEVRDLYRNGKVLTSLSTRDLVAWLASARTAEMQAEAGNSDEIAPLEYGFRLVYFDAQSDKDREKLAKAYNMHAEKELTLSLRNVLQV